MKLSKRLSRIEINRKYNGYQLELFNKTFRFFRYVWKSEDKPKKGKEEKNIVTYNFLFPSGSFNLTAIWNQKKGDYWEENGKKYYVKFTKNRIIIGKFILMWSLLNKNVYKIPNDKLESGY